MYLFLSPYLSSFLAGHRVLSRAGGHDSPLLTLSAFVALTTSRFLEAVLSRWGP